MKSLFVTSWTPMKNGLVSVTVTLETRDFGHFEDVKAALQQAKIRYAVQESVAFEC